MKKVLFIALIFSAFAFRASAQQKVPFSSDLKNYIGKKVTLCDTVYTYKVFNDTLTMLNMGGSYPNQKFTIVVKGKAVALKLDGLKGKHICVTGDLTLFKERPEVVVIQPDQLEFK